MTYPFLLDHNCRILLGSILVDGVSSFSLDVGSFGFDFLDGASCDISLQIAR
jgi:hypothetical protein